MEDNLEFAIGDEFNIALEGEELTSSQPELAKSIVDKCGGLPKVIAAIGACKSSWTLSCLRENFMGTLETDPEFYGLRPLFSWMQSYFDACSDSIKPCIFYLSIFSAEKNIRRRRLLWRWIAEGYCRDTSDGTTCEENGEEFISKLVNLSIIQESASSKMFFGLKKSSKVFCQINGFFHEYIISQPMEDNLVFALEGRCSLNSTRAGQHLTIRSTWDRRDRIVYESIDFSRLRSLTVFGEWESFFICSKNVNMRLLRVLDLEDAEGVTNDDLEQIAKLLTRLKFLSLRGHTKINCLPISMGGLRQLQTLDIRGTSIVTLPLFITKLQKLRYIRAGTTTSEAWDWEGGDVVLTEEADSEEDNRPRTPNNLVPSLLSKLCRSGGGPDNNGPAAGVKVPAGIKKLGVLHTLGVVNAAKPIFFKELKKLTQLRKLGVSGIKEGSISQFCEAISGHAHLKSLSVEVDKDGGNSDGLDGIPEPPKTLNSLKLYGRVLKLLVWIEQLPNLEKLKLDLTIEKPEELRDLISSNEPVVGHLRIKPVQDGELHFCRGWAFSRVVEFQCTSVLHIKFDDPGLSERDVKVLKVHFSGGSQSSLQISGLSRLKEVWLKGYTDAHKQDMQRQIDEIPQFRRPVLKLVQMHSS